ncbi:GntR family transcriptional regulator [Enemella evansiae]|uniref:GntR family transcriptional regulator n=1 Tax=Enemella evansiae TaxID=2016499 RepID=UPI000B9770AD|nr:GntR family transcriptional regulator [Enemella evansiae]OYO03159.1 GntR family transcriptional regulator [Enemella evansiae]
METPEAAPTTGRLRAYEYLRDNILTDPDRHGTFLNEQELASEIGVSRTPVREALLLLVADDLVELIPQRGAYIPKVGPREVSDLFEVRRVVEKHAASITIDESTVPGRAMGDLLGRQQELEVDDHASFKEFITLDRDFHQALVDAAGNRLFASLYAKLRARQMLVGIEAVLWHPNRMASVCAEHQAILDALIDGDLPAAHRAIDDHLSTTRGLVRERADRHPFSGHSR